MATQSLLKPLPLPIPIPIPIPVNLYFYRYTATYTAIPIPLYPYRYTHTAKPLSHHDTHYLCFLHVSRVLLGHAIPDGQYQFILNI